MSTFLYLRWLFVTRTFSWVSESTFSVKVDCRTKVVPLWESSPESIDDGPEDWVFLTLYYINTTKFDDSNTIKK